MTDDEVLADLQRLMGAPPEVHASDSLAELEALVHNHQERLNGIAQEYDSKRAVLEAQIAARSVQNDQAAKEAEIERIKAELKPAA